MLFVGRSSVKAILMFSLILVVIGAAHAQTIAYVANIGSNTISAIDTSSNMVVATIPTAIAPRSVAALPDGSRVYVAVGVGFVTVIDSGTNTIVANIPIAGIPS